MYCHYNQDDGDSDGPWLERPTATRPNLIRPQQGTRLLPWEGKELITSAYSTWDDNDPFHGGLNTRATGLSMEDTLLQAFQTMPQLAQGLRTMMAQHSSAGPTVSPQALPANIQNNGNPRQANAGTPNVTCFSCGNHSHYTNTCLIANNHNTNPSQGVNLNSTTTHQQVAAHAALGTEGGSQAPNPAMCVLPMSIVDQANAARQDKGKAPERRTAVPGAGV